MARDVALRRQERSELIAQQTLNMSRSHLGQTVLLPTAVRVARELDLKQPSMYKDKSFGEHAGNTLGLQVIHDGLVLGREASVTDYSHIPRPDEAVSRALEILTAKLSPEQIGSLLVALAAHQPPLSGSNQA